MLKQIWLLLSVLIIGSSSGYFAIGYIKVRKSDQEFSVLAEELIPGFELTEEILGQPVKFADTFNVIQALYPPKNGENPASPTAAARHFFSQFNSDELKPQNSIIRVGRAPNREFWFVEFPGCGFGTCGDLNFEAIMRPSSENEWQQYDQKGRTILIAHETIRGVEYFLHLNISQNSLEEIGYYSIEYRRMASNPIIGFMASLTTARGTRSISKILFFKNFDLRINYDNSSFD